MNKINLLKDKKKKTSKEDKENYVINPVYRDSFIPVDDFCETFNLVEESWQRQQ